MYAKQAIKQMYELMETLSEFGASDTEPRGVFADILHDQLEGKLDVVIPLNASGWQLYSDEPGAEDAAKVLAKWTEAVLEIANADHRGFVQAMSYYFN